MTFSYLVATCLLLTSRTRKIQSITGRKNRGCYTMGRVVPHVCKNGNGHLQQRQSGRERNVVWQRFPYSCKRNRQVFRTREST